MTQEKRIKIAEACGWKPHYSGDGFGSHPIHAPKQMERLPNYFNDLNAMHEAEKLLTEEQLNKMCELLYEVPGRFWRATAAQRAEAFGRVKGLWE